METRGEVPEERFFLVEHKSTETTWVKNSINMKTPSDIMKEACRFWDIDQYDYKLAWGGGLLLDESPLPQGLTSTGRGEGLPAKTHHVTLDLIEANGLGAPVFVRLADPSGVTHCAVFRRSDCLLDVVKKLFHDFRILKNPSKMKVLHKDKIYTYDDCNHIQILDLTLEEDPWLQIRIDEDLEDTKCCLQESDYMEEYLKSSPWMDEETKTRIRNVLEQRRETPEWTSCQIPPPRESLIAPYFGLIYKEEEVEKFLKIQFAEKSSGFHSIYRRFAELDATDCGFMTRCLNSVVVRIAFPSPFVLQGIFSQNHRICHVKEFVKSCLINEKLHFNLYERWGLGVALDSNLTLETAGLIGQGFLFFATDSSRLQPWFQKQYLQSSLLEESVSRTVAASVAAAYAKDVVGPNENSRLCKMFQPKETIPALPQLTVFHSRFDI